MQPITDGVCIWLADGTQLNSYAQVLLGSRRAELGVLEEGSAKHFFLEVPKAEAGFIGGGAVDLRLKERSRKWLVCFQGGLEVLRITSQKTGKVLQVNYRFCRRCFANTGIPDKECEPDSQIATRYILTYRCPCGNVWKRSV